MFLIPKSNKSIIFIILVLCLVGGTIFTSLQTSGQNNQTVQSSTITNSDDTLDPLMAVHPSLSYSYYSHAPIDILYDFAFTYANGVVSGSGTSDNPYIIEGWKIITSGTHGIRISGTTKHFIVRNNFIDTGGVNYKNGILIGEISGNAKIENNFCQNNDNGIQLSASSSYNIVTNNTCNFNKNNGIELMYSSNNNTLTNNTCNSNNNNGIELYRSDYNSLTNNVCNLNNNNGIKLFTSDFTSFTSNICNSNNDYGIYLYSSSDFNSFTSNYCSNNVHGIFLDASTYNSLTSNTCNSNYNYGIYLKYSDYNSLTSNNCSNNDHGIELYSSNYNSLTNNTCYLNNLSGIKLYFSDNNSLMNNTCNSNNNHGIYLYTSDFNSLMNNTCNSNNNHGIYLYMSNYNYLTDNRCNINNNYGIWIYFFSNDNSLINNTCNSNNYDGIHLYASDLNLLSWNLLFDNVFGVYLSSGSDNNTIHHNTFINNSNSPQAYDDGSNNIWFDILTNEGNFWSDYSGSGNYQIGGGAGSIDPYPSNEPTVIIIIAEFTLLKGSFLALFMSFVRLCHIRRKNIKVN